jgi:hypothetical protein
VLSLPYVRDQGWKKIKSQDPGSGMNNENLILKTILSVFFGMKILKSFDANPDPGSGILSTLDPGSKIRDRNNRIRDPWSGKIIPDPQHWIMKLCKRNWRISQNIAKFSRKLLSYPLNVGTVGYYLYRY